MKTVTINNTERFLKGFHTVCDAVKQTLGAEGKLAVMESELMGAAPTVTKDGVSVARRIFFKDKHKNMGATLAKQVAAKSLATTGDSTTTSLVLAQAILNSVDGSRFNKKVEKGINIGIEEIFSQIKLLSKTIDDDSAKKIATVSANNDAELGSLVFDAYKIVGESGIIDVKQKESGKTELVTSNGMKLNKGWKSPFMCNNPSKARFEGEDVYVVAYEGILEADPHLEKFFTEVYQNEEGTAKILIIAEQFSEDVVVKIDTINQQGKIEICAVHSPEYDNKRLAIIRDIALYTDGEVFLRGTSDKVIPGKVDKVVVDMNSTTLFKENLPDKVELHINELKQSVKRSGDRDFIKKRIANLEGSSATILVGGITESEIKERFDLVDDAVGAIKSSLEDGYICGGGATLVFISENMNQVFDNEDVQYGYDAIKKAIQAPFRQICINSNRDPEVYLESMFYKNQNFIERLLEISKSKKQATYGIGYNASTDELSNLFDDGIIDSSKSIKSALENAKSVTILLLNTRVVISI
jgi:chaperonin GroEL